MKEYEIVRIRKPNRDGRHESIEAIGYNDNPTLLGGSTVISRDNAIDLIESGRARFYVSDGSNKIFVEVVEEVGKKYIRTIPDGKKDNNLLSLPEC